MAYDPNATEVLTNLVRSFDSDLRFIWRTFRDDHMNPECYSACVISDFQRQLSNPTMPRLREALIAAIALLE